MTNQFSEFLANLSILKSRFTFIVVTETWLTGEKDIGLDINGYKSHSVYRDDTIGGGIKMYIRTI